MRHIDNWVILFLALMLLVLGACTHSYINNSAARVAAPLPDLAAAIENEDWPEARALFSQSRREWQQVAKIWPILINHNEMRDVEQSFGDMEILLEQQDSEQASRELVSLGYHLRHVPDDERLSWQNIL